VAKVIFATWPLSPATWIAVGKGFADCNPAKEGESGSDTYTCLFHLKGVDCLVRRLIPFYADKFLQ
jgi:hypothetical protein